MAAFLGASVLNNVSVSFNFDTSTTPPPAEEGENVTTAFNMLANNELYEGVWMLLGTVMLGLTFIMLIYSIIMFTIGSAVSIGYCQFNLDMVDGFRPRVGTLFSCFSQMKTAIVAKLLTAVYIMLGSLLIVPGIIMTFSYSMVNFVLAENPEMTATEALRESKRIMKGHKWQLFCLNLSFLGWAFLCIFTLGIASIWVAPYSSATYAEFYRHVKAESAYAY